MLRVGLTGGIACGKSQVLRRLAEGGVPTLDLDSVAHELMEPGGAAYEEVVAAFGGATLGPDGRVDRQALGARVFADPEARARLNAIVHPKVRAEEARRAALHSGRGALFVTDAALLVETGLHLRFDRLVVVHCAAEEQRRRLRARDGLTEEAATARLQAQMPIDEKRAFGHWRLDTSGTVAETNAKADRLARELADLAPSRPPTIELAPERALGLLVHGPARGPRGLDPLGLLAEITAVGGLELERIAAMLVPAGDGPWYRRARDGDARDPGPESLAGPLVLWALARGGADPPFLLSAAASLARLTHPDPESVAAAGLAALALLDVARGRAPLEGSQGRLEIWRAEAETWAGAPPPLEVEGALRAAFDHARHPEAARQAARSTGSDPGIAGALVGMAVGVAPEAAPAAARDAVRALERLGRR
jgi:dephospho-CoA kinase